MPEQRPPQRLGDLQVLRLLGEGGMGSVWLAYDEALGRRVALKWLRQSTPTLVERLQREAHLHARVEHPAVCRLYQVGLHEGSPYLVMQYVDGRTLDRLEEALGLRELLGLFAALAEGVHAAHRQGLIHRDLKPSNLMVERDGEGGLHPYVLDFGLARDAGEEALTEAGCILGTPAFMAPEQVAGGWLDPRTDVYGLGASLFALLAGRPPFLGDRAQVLAQVQTREAPALRGLVRTIPRDLDTVVATCLAIDPARRYPSAAALAEDLRRIQDQRPILARPASRLVRMGRWAARNRLAAGLAAGTVLLSLGLGLTWVLLRQRAQAQASWAQRFGQEALRMDSILRFGRMLPPHDVARELAQVRRRMDAVRQQMSGTRAGRGPGHFTLGEGHLLLGELEPAKRELEAAWRAGFRSAEVSLAYGRCLALLYQNAMAGASGILDPKAREAAQAEHRRGLLAPALDHVQRARKELGTLALEDQARLALAEDRFDEAERLARQAGQAEPWRYDALFLLAKARALRGRVRLDEGKKTEGLVDLGAALELSEELQRIGPSDDRLQDVAKFVWQQGAAHRLRGLEPLEAQVQAVASAERMLALNSTRVDMLHVVALNLGQLGKRMASAGRDPEPWFQRAEQLMRQVVSAPPGAYPPLVRGRAFERLANLAYQRGARIVNAGGVPEEQVQHGLAWCRQAESEGLAQWESHQNRAFLEMVRADHVERSGGDASGPLERAVAALRDCASLNPSADSHANLAELANRLARVQLARGVDPAAALASSREALAKALALRPEDPNALGLEGDRTLLEARWIRQGGGDPGTVLERGAATLARAAALAPEEAWIHASRCLLHAFRAQGAADLQQAKESGRRALELKVDDPKPVRAALARISGR